MGSRLALGAWLATAVMATPAFAETPAPPPIQAAPLTPAEMFGRLDFVENVTMSPDGQAMAGIFGIRGERRICIMDLFDAPKQHCARVPDGMEPFSLRWAGNNNIIVGVETIISIASPFLEGPDNAYVSRLIALNRATGKITFILPKLGGFDASQVLWMANDDSPEIEVSGSKSILEGEDYWPGIYRVNVETGKSNEVQRGFEGILDWSADGSGLVRAGVGYDDNTRTARLRYRGEHGGDFHTVDRADYTKRQSLLDPVLFLPGADHALALHDDDHEHGTLYEVDMLTGKDVSTYYAADGGRGIDSVWADDAGANLIGARLSGPSHEVHYFDPTLAALQAQFEGAVKAPSRVHIAGYSKDRKHLLVIVDRPDSPGGLYFYDTADGTMHRIAYMNEGLGMRANAPNSLVHYKARDGLDIEAVLTLPKGREARNLPIIMLPHGGPWAQDDLTYDYWAQYIASQGYAVMQPNFRGSTGYGETFERKGEGQMGFAMQDDISDGLAWAVKQGIADPKRACIIGASYGGYAAMWGIEKDPDQYRCAISIAGVANLRREVDDFGESLMGGKFKDDWQRMTPDFAAVSPINFVGKIKAPLLLIHGQKDLTVDPVQSKKMYAAMQSAGKTVEYLPIPLADHHFQREADRVTLLNAIGAFLAKYNPADKP